MHRYEAQSLEKNPGVSAISSILVQHIFWATVGRTEIDTQVAAGIHEERLNRLAREQFRYAATVETFHHLIELYEF